MPLKKSGSKVFLLLSVLSEEELADFRFFLQMPTVKATDTLRALLEYCIPFYPDFDERSVGKEAVHEALFAGQEYKEKRIRDLFSDLSLKVEAYFGWRAFAKEDAYGEALLVGEYLRRGLEDFARLSGDRSLERWQDTRTVRADRLLSAFFVQTRFLGLDGEGDWVERVLRGAQERLDQFFVLSKLRLALMLFSRRGYLAGSQEMRFWNDIRRELAREEWPEPVKLYLMVLELVTSDFGGEDLLNAILEYEKQAPHLSMEDKKALHQGLVNAALRMINEKDANLFSELWQLYQMGLEDGAIYAESGELSDTTFTNIVINGANLREYDWTARFIETNAPRLSQDIRDNAVALGQAFWNYQKGDYGQVVEILRDVRYSSVAYAVRGRSLLLRTYFDQAASQGWNFSSEFYYHGEAFIRYVQRNKELSENRKQAYLNFIAFTRKIAKAAAPDAAPGKMASLREEIESASQLIAKEWLLERAGMLPGR
jgi:hypothetical protein